MLTTVNYYLYYKCESRHYSAAEKKAFLCFKHWILLSEKSLRFFFGAIWMDIGFLSNEDDSADKK